MTSERILGGAVTIFGGFLLVFAIPHNVVSTGGLILNPALFPQIAAWLLVGLGILQILSAKKSIPLPPLREVTRLLVVAAFTLAALLVLDIVGFLVTTIALMIVIEIMSYERRWLWLATTILGLPVGVWLFFEILLRRPLP